MKRLYISVFIFLLTQISLIAQESNQVSELYTKGFNDAYNILPYKKAYDINKLGRTLGRLSSKKQLTQADIDFIEAVSDYNEGYINGLYEKYRLDKNKYKEMVKPMPNLDDELTYSQISIPEKEELEAKKSNEE